MRRLLILLLLLVQPVPAAADAGWREAFVSVADLDERIAFFRDVIGWEVVGRGAVSRSQLDAWRLPPAAAAETALVRSPGADSGVIRLVQFSGLPAAARIRSSARPWEAGGWAGLNVRVRSIEAVFARLQRAGWQGFSEPVTFTVPPFRVSEVMVVGPDGLTLSLIERLDPPLQADWRSLWSPAITVFEADVDPIASRAFYEGRLGLESWLNYDGPAADPGMNLFGLPHDVVGRVTRQVSWWREGGRGDGTIATLAFRGVTGRRFPPEMLGPPRLGLFLIAIQVDDAAERCGRLAGLGTGFIRPAAVVDRPGTGPQTSCTLATPSGSWLELYDVRRVARLPPKG
jgi:catechol 2,3-dioxygenase-like lactoylglutathione lyase family enzyme